MTKIVNIRMVDNYDVYIGRAGKGKNGYFGNSHPIGYCSICKRSHDRKDSINEFKKDFLKRIEFDEEFREKVENLKDKILGCFCAPNSCHGDVYKEYVDNLPS